METAAGLLADLGSTIAEFEELVEASEFLLIPGPEDPGPAPGLVPRPPLPGEGPSPLSVMRNWLWEGSGKAESMRD